ncbi:hypothetical protein [Paraburkholderia sp. BL21I4N1]|uniref:hypothetical protein n=1 Tax=Paraburkholderia sp. BL21I4N1 TaxID=1938801 RepID=UPI000CFDC56C|nr:hypothetical protein [Paraburkholderia sp. BL21I4N1]PQV52956.1 hypothetical protein B0G83_10236 [Paraburkholderia sp. BL21I4N1]
MDTGLFSQSDSRVIGSFHYGHAIIAATSNDEALELYRNPALIDSYGGDQARIFELLLEANSIIHERLHFLHSFGTIAGLSLFSERMVASRRFMEAGYHLKTTGALWTLPLSKAASDPNCPDVIRKLRRYARSYRVANDMFLAPYSKIAVDGHTDLPWLDVPVETVGGHGDPKIPAFPLSIDLPQETGSSRPISVLIPLGYEALVEGIAHSMARSVTEALFPELSAELFVKYGPPRKVRVGTPESDIDEVASRTDIYMATDFLISKYLRSKGIAQFARETVVKLSDIALSSTFFSVEDVSDKDTMIKVQFPGYSLVRALEQADPISLEKAEIEYPESIDKIYANILERLSAGGDWDTVEGSNSLFMAPKIWESFCAHHITVPLLKSRIENGNKSFYDSTDLFMTAARMALPRVEVLNGGVKFIGIPEPVKNAWGKQLFVSEIAQQVFADSDVIFCPRAHPTLPGMDHLDFAGGKCKLNIKRGCGSCIPGQNDFHPPCLFTNALKELGFIKPDPREAKSEQTQSQS